MLKPIALHILLALADRESHGYAMTQAIREQSGGQVPVQTASFYRHLGRLMDYGVTAYSVSRRRPEIAVRMALGASAGGVVRLVLRRVVTLLVFGAAIGVGLSLWAAKFVGALLFRVDARDPITLAGATAILLAVGLLAGWLPARKASRLDPTTALRG